MNTFFKYSAIALAVTSLSACLEVEDNNNNDDVVAALQQQNDLLAEQNAKQQAENSVTLTGKVHNLSTDTVAQNATVKVKVGNEWSEPVSLNSNGSFELTLLPNNSDFTLLVSSTDSAFLERAFFGTTKSASTGVSVQEVGLLNVSQGKTYSFPVLDSSTGESVTNLDIYASSRVVLASRFGQINDYQEYYHRATYNEETQKYDLILPQNDLPHVYGQLDIDNDGTYDYVSDKYNSSSILLRPEDVSKQNTVYLTDLQILERDIELRVTVLDTHGQAIGNQHLSIEDQDATSVYDEETLQHVLTGTLSNSLKVLLPSFVHNEVTYSSSYISVSVQSERLWIRNTINNTYNYYYLPLDTEVIDVVLVPGVTNYNSSLEVVYKTSDSNSLANQFQVYYSNAIELTESSVSLIKKSEVAIIRGNDSADDLILEGSTLIETKDVEVSSNKALSLNSTLLTVQPQSSLQGGHQYQYQVNDIIDVTSSNAVDLSDDKSITFVAKETTLDDFDINSIKLDNLNFRTNGEIITPENSAGEAANPNDSANYVSLFVPKVVESQLNTLTLKRLVETKNGEVSNNVDSWTVIRNGSFVSGRKGYTIRAAINEEIIDRTASSFPNLYRGTAQSNTYVQVIGISGYFSDNTDASENSMTFEYAYETVQGEVATGTITLPVL